MLALPPFIYLVEEMSDITSHHLQYHLVCQEKTRQLTGITDTTLLG